MVINLEYDPNALAAPQSFRDGVQAAADILDAAIYDPITVNIEVGYGEFDYGGPESTPLSSYSLGGIISSIDLSYPLLRAALAQASAIGAQDVASLPDTASLDGQSTFFVAGAQAKALGALPATDAAVDGYIGFPTSFTGNGLIHAALAEIIHAMGVLTDGNGVLTLFEYTSPGIHVLTPGYTSSVPAYFSTNGGNMDLAQYDVSFDDTLFVDPTDAAFSVAGSGTTLTGVDLTEIGSIGYDVSGPAALPASSITPTATASNAPAVVNVHNVSVGENAAIPALSLITSVSAPSGDSIVAYSFYDQGSESGGYFAVDGVAEPDDRWVYALNTQLSALQYVGGSEPGSQTLYIDAFDYASDAFTQESGLTATTIIPPTADMILRQGTTGDYEIYDIGKKQILGAHALGQVGTEWVFAGLGDFSGADTSDMLLRDSVTGAFEVYDISNDSITVAAALGQVGMEWQVAGLGDFSGNPNETDMLLRNVTTGAFEVYDINDSRLASASALGQVGLEWQAAGLGDFSGNRNETDLMLRNVNTGAFEIYDIANNQLAGAASLGQIGLEWQVGGLAPDPRGNGSWLPREQTAIIPLFDRNRPSRPTFGQSAVRTDSQGADAHAPGAVVAYIGCVRRHALDSPR